MNSETAVHGGYSLQAVIANITEQGYTAQRTYGTFQIVGRSGAEDPPRDVSRGAPQRGVDL